MYAKGGKVEFVDSKSDKSWYYKRFDGAIGSFAWIYDKKYHEGILYPFDDFDRKYYSHLKLKPNEVLLRYSTERMVFGEKFLIKFNLDKGLVYFMDSDRMSDNDDKNIIFQGRGIPLQYMVVEKDKIHSSGEHSMSHLIGTIYRPFSSNNPDHYVEIVNINFDIVEYLNVDGMINKANTEDFFNYYIAVSGKYAKGGEVDKQEILDLKRKIKHFREVEKNESMARYYEEALFYLTQGKNQDILKHDKYAMGGTTPKSTLMGIIPNKGNHRNEK